MAKEKKEDTKVEEVKVEEYPPFCSFSLIASPGNSGKTVFKAMDGEAEFSSLKMREALAWLEDRFSLYLQ